MGRGAGWKDDEDLSLTRSFVHVSHDAVLGADQKLHDFWDKVQVQFATFQPGTKRSSVALQTRWRILQHSINSFCGCYEQATGTCESGQNQEGYIEEALEMYASANGEPFDHRVVWEYLRKEVPKFEERLQFASPRSKRKLEHHDDASSIDRSAGTKKTKQAEAEKKSSSDIQKEYVAEAKKRNQLLQEQNELFRNMQLVTRATTSTEGLSSAAKRMVSIAQKIELKKLLNDADQSGVEIED